MSVDYKAYLLVGYEVNHSYYEEHYDDEKAMPYLLNPNYYYETDKYYFGKIIGEVDAGYGCITDINVKTYNEASKELFNAKSKVDGINPTSIPFPKVYLICAIH